MKNINPKKEDSQTPKQEKKKKDISPKLLKNQWSSENLKATKFSRKGLLTHFTQRDNKTFLTIN